MAASKSSAKAGSSETKLIRELASILNETELTEIEMEKGDLKIRVSKTNEMVAAPMQAYAPAPAPAAASQPVAAPAAKTEKADAGAHPGLSLIHI